MVMDDVKKSIVEIQSVTFLLTAAILRAVGCTNITRLDIPVTILGICEQLVSLPNYSSPNFIICFQRRSKIPFLSISTFTTLSESSTFLAVDNLFKWVMMKNLWTTRMGSFLIILSHRRFSRRCSALSK